MSAVLFHLFTAGFSPLTALIQRPVHLGLMATLGFLGLSLRRGAAGLSRGEASSSAIWRFFTPSTAMTGLAVTPLPSVKTVRIFEISDIRDNRETLLRPKRQGRRSALPLVHADSGAGALRHPGRTDVLDAPDAAGTHGKPIRYLHGSIDDSVAVDGDPLTRQRLGVVGCHP